MVNEKVRHETKVCIFVFLVVYCSAEDGGADMFRKTSQLVSIQSSVEIPQEYWDVSRGVVLVKRMKIRPKRFFAPKI